MSADIALVWNDALFEADIAMSDGDLLTDQGLQTAVIVSLLTDRVAEPGDEIPDGTDDRRGWWGDMGCSADPASWQGDRIGSRLWLLARAKAIPATALRAKNYVAEALQWLIDDGVAETVDITTTWLSMTGLGILVVITQNGASKQYSLTWQATAGA